MPLYPFQKIQPELGRENFVAPSCDVIGKVKTGAHVSLWHQCSIRGDMNFIEIGEETNIQDLSCLHVTDEFPVIVGKGVTIGHQVTLHACTIEDYCLIGMGSIILDGARIKRGCVVAAGSVVPPGKSYPEDSLILGSPAKVKRELTEEEKSMYHNHYKSYLKLSQAYLNP